MHRAALRNIFCDAQSRSKLKYLNFNPPEVMSRYRDTQL